MKKSLQYNLVKEGENTIMIWIQYLLTRDPQKTTH